MITNFDSTTPVNFLPILRLLPNSSLANLKRGIQMRDSVLAKVLKERRETFDPENLRDFTDLILSELKKQELEDRTAQNLVDDVNLQQILSDLFIAGIETTTTVLTCAFGYLARHPDVQKCIAEER